METTYKKQYDPKLVEFVEKLAGTSSGPERWGMAITAWLNKNETIETPDGLMTARQYNRLQIKHNKFLRDELANKYGALEGGALRFALSLPESMWELVKMCDPGAFNSGHGNNELVSANLAKFMKAFPEYRIAEKI